MIMIKKILDRIDVKLFLTFFIVSLFFIRWSGWSEDSRFALIKSIVENQKLEIDDNANTTGDRSFYNGHYYTDKAPGQSILGAQLYFSLNLVFKNFLEQDTEKPLYIEEPQFDTVTYALLNPDDKILISRILLTVFFSSLPSALLIVLMYKTAKMFTEKEKYAILITFSMGLGTLILPYSTIFNGNILAAFLVFLSFHIMLKLHNEELDRKYYFISGLFLSFSIVVDYTTIFMFIPSFIFLLYTKKFSVIPKFILGVLLGILPLFIYNFIIFSNPITFTLIFLDPDISPCIDVFYDHCVKSTLIHFYLNPVYILSTITKILFLPYRGLLFYYPLLLFSFIGLFILYKNNRELTVFILVLILQFILFYGSILYWWGGTNFGPKHFATLIPFLLIPLVFFVEKNKNKILYYLFFILIIISILHNISSFSASWEEPHAIDSATFYLHWYTKTFSSKSIELANVLYGHFIPAFLHHGPVSILIDGFLRGELPDIRINSMSNIPKFEYYPTSVILPNGFLVINTKFFVLYLISLFVFIIWSSYLKFQHKIMFISVFLVVFISFISLKSTIYTAGWYNEEHDNGRIYRFMSQDGVVKIFSRDNTRSKIVIELYPFYKQRILQIYLNGEFVGSYDSVNHALIQELNLHKGENILELISVEDCGYVGIAENSTDSRCLSFKIYDLNLTSIK